MVINSSLSNLPWALRSNSGHCFCACLQLQRRCFFVAAATWHCTAVKYLIGRDFLLHAFLCVQVRNTLPLVALFLHSPNTGNRAHFLCIKMEMKFKFQVFKYFCYCFLHSYFESIKKVHCINIWSGGCNRVAAHRTLLQRWGLSYCDWRNRIVWFRQVHFRDKVP